MSHAIKTDDERMAKEKREQAAALEKIGTEQNEAVLKARKQFSNTVF